MVTTLSLAERQYGLSLPSTLELVTDRLLLIYFDSHQQVASGRVDLAIFDSSTL